MTLENNPKYTEILVQDWARKRQFEHFTKNFTSPWFDMTVHLDVTHLLQTCKTAQMSFFHTFVFFVAKSLNAIESFRMRIREDRVVIWEKVHPQYTVLSQEENLLYCPVVFHEDLASFLTNSQNAARLVVEHGAFRETSKETDNLILLSCLPWVSFLGVTQPIFKNVFDSRPRLVWGKYFFDQSQNKTLMPLQIMAHHATVDGLHMAKAFETIQFEIDTFKTNIKII